MKKTILFILNRECIFLPPFLTILDALSESYELKVISFETEESYNHICKIYSGKDVKFLSKVRQNTKMTLFSRGRNRIRRILNIKDAFYHVCANLIEKTHYDLLWVIHEWTLSEFKHLLTGKKYVLSVYELEDVNQKFLKENKKAYNEACEIIVPEYNRACILRVWQDLKATPTVLPNKPLHHPSKKQIKNDYSEVLEGKKIILYQGYIQRSRNIDAVCRACQKFPEYKLLLLGKGDDAYINEILTKYRHIIHIPYVSPPNHLYITSYARIGIVKYDFVSLNAIFCAPNKTWEYTGFGIPVLAHNIPGLQDTIGKYRAGVCCDMDDEDRIAEAIMTIEINYDSFSQNSLNFYHSVNIREIISDIVKRNII